MDKGYSLLDRFIGKYFIDKTASSLFDYIESDFSKLELGLFADVVTEPKSASLIDYDLLFTRNIKTIDPFITFDAVFDCEIETEQIIKREPEQESVNEWVRVSCKAKITDRLDSFEVTGISGYRKERKDSGRDIVSDDFIPVISKTQLDDIAQDFLIRYHIEALEKPMPVPIEDIIRDKMKLDIVRDYRISPDFSIFGMLSYHEGDIPVYTDDDEELLLTTNGATVFVDPYVSFLRNIGCKNNNLAHEAVHWDKHRIYSVISGLLDGESHIANRCATEPNEDVIQNSFQTPEEWMEWQANWLAPKILMPLNTFRTKAQELVKVFGYKPLDKNRFDALKNVIDELAIFYRVSKQSARIRLMEIGYEDAFHIYNYSEKAPEIRYTISIQDAFDEYIRNESFRKVIDSGMFTYVEESFVIDHESLIDRSGDEPCLTQKAIDDLPLYALKFTDQMAYYTYYSNAKPTENEPDALFKKNPDSKRINRFDSADNDDTLSRAAEITRISEKIADSYDADNDSVKAFCKKVHREMDKRKWTYSVFENRTQQNRNFYYEICRGELKNPKLKTVIAICIGLGLDSFTSHDLLRQCGHVLRYTQEENIYRMLIESCSDKGIDFANELLEHNGYEPLGSAQRV